MRRVFGLIPHMFKMMLMARFIKQLPTRKIEMLDKPASMEILRELLASGKLTPHIDRTFALSEVPAAMRYLESGHAQGKIVVTIG